MNGKGSGRRPETNHGSYEAGWERLFGKKKPKQQKAQNEGETNKPRNAKSRQHQQK